MLHKSNDHLSEIPEFIVLHYIIRKPMKHRFQLMSVRKYCQLFTHARLEYIYVIPPIPTNGGANGEKIPRNSPFPLRHVDRYLRHQCLGPPHSPCQTTTRSVHAVPRNYATKAPLVTMGRPQFTQNCPFHSTITTKI